jgi:hypothetical protein
VAIVALLALAGCGGDDDGDEGGSTTEAGPTIPAGADPYFAQMDGYAVKLEGAIARAYNGDPLGEREILALREDILTAVNDRLLEGEDSSVGGNFLLSVATAARDALRRGDREALNRSRRGVPEAREKLAVEAGG